MSDTGMNVTSLAVSAVGLAALWDVCVKGCSFVSRAQATSDKAQQSLARIEAERCRLNIWGRTWGMSDNMKCVDLTRLEHDLNLGDVRKIIHNNLTSISKAVCEIETLKDKYGLEFEDLHPRTGADTIPSKISGDPVHHPAVSASVQSWEAHSAQRDKDLTVLKKASFSFTDDKRLDELAKTLSEHVRQLWDMMMAETMKRIEQQLDAEILAGNNRWSNLELLLEAIDRPAIRRHVDNQIAKRRLESQQEQISCVYKPQKKILGRIKLEPSAGASDPRVLADLERDNRTGPIRVLVEWKRGPWADEDAARRMEARVDGLAIMLGRMTSDPAGDASRVLRCEGYFEHTEKDTFGLVYRFPDHSDPLRAPVSLYGLLDGENSLMAKDPPSLDSRVQLAKQLVRSLHEIHCSGWLHKQISSKNIVFFWPRAAPGGDDGQTPLSEASLGAPYIVSFDLSRPTGETWGTEEKHVSHGHAVDLRRHPDQSAHPSARRHDIYSLGLVLMEIASWQPIESIVEEHDSFHERILEELEPLDFEVGKGYRGAVEMMLRSVKEEKYTWREAAAGQLDEHVVADQNAVVEAAEKKMLLDFYYEVVDRLVRPVLF